MKDLTESDLINNIPLAAVRSDCKRSTVKIGNVEVGGDSLVVIAGPCAVESEAQVLDIAHAVKASGATMLRGGAFKPLTFPYRNEHMYELGEEGLRYLKRAGSETGLPTVSEVVDVRLVSLVAKYVDVLQIGARNMQNFPLLEEAGKTLKPVLLKRHFGSSLRDWLGAAEYILKQGNERVILCERGVSTAHTHSQFSRFIVDLQSVPAVREYSHLPVIVDPSHSTFRRRYVAPVARAAIAVGADGIIIDVHPVPEKAAVDPLQALNYSSFDHLVKELRGIGKVIGRKL
jgi:3-deoxy-7-phosphoheptulonate synthase